MAHGPKYPIQLKISLFVVAMVITAVGGFAAFSTVQFRRDKVDYLLQFNGSIASTIGQQLDLSFDSLSRTVQRYVRVLQVADSANSKILRELLRADPDLFSFSIYSLSGDQPKLLNSMAQEGEIPDLKSLTQEMLTIAPQLTLGGAPEFRARGSVLAAAAVKVHGPGGNPVIAIFYFKKNYLETFFQNATFGNQLLVDNSGKIVVLPASMTLESLDGHELFNYATDHRARQGRMEFSFAGKRYIGAFYNLRNGWTVLSQVERNTAVESVDQMLIAALIFALVLGIVMLSVGVWFSHSITMPLRALMRMVDELAAGNFETGIHVDTHDETFELASHFTMLVERLRHREEKLEKVTELATRDQMTGLYNNRYFRQCLQRQLDLHRRKPDQFTVLLTDIDHFKRVNDTYGHLQGDEVLREFADILSQACRSTDIVARYGGEEFAILCPDSNLKSVQILANRIRERFQNHSVRNIAGGEPLRGTCSIGLACISEGNFATPEDMIQHADKKLYKAKNMGRNRVWTDAA